MFVILCAFLFTFLVISNVKNINNDLNFVKKKKKGEEKGRNILYKETNQYWLILATSGVRA